MGDLMARVGSLQLRLETAGEREAELRAQNEYFRSRLVEAGLAVEPPSPETEEPVAELPESEPAVTRD